MTELTDIPNRPAWAQAVYERQLATLARLAEMGMTIGGVIEREAGTDGDFAPDALRAFEAFPRIARAVRLTLMLEDRVVRHILGEDRVEVKDSQRGGKDAIEPITEIRRIIVDPRAPDSGAHDPRSERLTAEVGERPDREHGPRDFARSTAPDPVDEAATETIDVLDQDLDHATDAANAYDPFLSRLEDGPPNRRRPAGGRGSPGGWGV